MEKTMEGFQTSESILGGKAPLRLHGEKKLTTGIC